MCAIVGVFGNDEASKISSMALFSMQHRGHEASGISSTKINTREMFTIKGKGYVRDIFDDNSFKILKGDMAIGHNRYSTAGSDSILDAQPIQAKYKLGEISIVHNGNLTNHKEIRKELSDEGSIFQTNMDTENLIHLIAKSKEEKLKNRIIESLGKIKGCYNFIIQSRSKLFVLKDKYGIRPLSIGKLKSGGWIVSSETCSFDLVDATFVRDVKPGEMLIFSKNNEEPESIMLDEAEHRPCAFEYIYFSRPDSVIDGVSVYGARKKMGELLAKSDIDASKYDMVIPVPDSGVPAALGYANESKIPFELGIIRNHYVGRTFIEPTQALRDIKVRMKLSPLAAIIKGKSIIVVDDSIVRGTTSKRIVKLLRLAGAKEVHFRVASPEIKFPCYYGIDTPNKCDLISSNKSVKEVCEYIEADSLAFLHIDDLQKSLRSDRNYSLPSFTGEYFVK